MTMQATSVISSLKSTFGFNNMGRLSWINVDLWVDGIPLRVGYVFDRDTTDTGSFYRWTLESEDMKTEILVFAEDWGRIKSWITVNQPLHFLTVLSAMLTVLQFLAQTSMPFYAELQLRYNYSHTCQRPRGRYISTSPGWEELELLDFGFGFRVFLLPHNPTTNSLHETWNQLQLTKERTFSLGFSQLRSQQGRFAQPSDFSKVWQATLITDK